MIIIRILSSYGVTGVSSRFEVGGGGGAPKGE